MSEIGYVLQIAPLFVALVVVWLNYRSNWYLKRTETVLKIKQETYAKVLTGLAAWSADIDEPTLSPQDRADLVERKKSVLDARYVAWLVAPRAVTDTLQLLLDRALTNSEEPADALVRQLVLAMRRDMAGNSDLDSRVIAFDILREPVTSNAAVPPKDR